MRTFLRTLLACALLFGGLGWSWAPVDAAAQEPHACCCGMVPGPHDSCPCPKPETPSPNGCGTRAQGLTAPLVLLQRAAQEDARRVEPSPAPEAVRLALAPAEVPAPVAPTPGRDPDVGRHLARLSLLRI